MRQPIPSGSPAEYAARARAAADRQAQRNAAQQREQAARSNAVAEWRSSLPNLDELRTGRDLATFCRAIDADRYPYPAGGLGPGFGFPGKPVGWLRRRRFAKNYTVGTAVPDGRPVVMPKAADHRGSDWNPTSKLVVAAGSGHLAHITTDPGARRRTRIRWMGPSQQLPDELRAGVVAWLERFVTSQR